MHASKTLLAAAFTALSITTALAQGAPGAGQPNIAVLTLACVVAGSPGGLANDIRLTNKGNTPLPAGTRIAFRVLSTGVRGYVGLPAALPAGAQVGVSNVFRGTAPSGTPCTARAAS